MALAGRGAGLETVIEPAAGGDPIAWFPYALSHIATHPSGRLWAGSVGGHLYMIQLEGEPEPGPSPRESALKSGLLKPACLAFLILQ